MRIWRRLTGVFLLRKAFGELAGIRAALTEQNRLLTRLADTLAPPPAVQVSSEQLAAQTGVDFIDAADQALLLQYMERTQRDTGHVPDEDEQLSYLADEKTQHLHRRLIERDEESERIRLSRRG